jgi:DNA-binding CsgD family transcriptional regulator
MNDWPLVGREAELSRLAGLLADGRTRGAVLVSAAGMGKTRLAQECLVEADRLGMAGTRITGMKAASGIPLGAMAPLLPPAQPGADRREPDERVDRADLMRRLALALVGQAAPRRLCLLVDNAHLLDDASATLVHQLAATSDAFVLATVRSAEPVPEPVLALWKDGLAERIELPGLTTDAIGDLLARVLGDPVDPATAARLARRCQGNVMFLRELVAGGLADGSLSVEGGMWHTVGSLVPSERLVDLVEARLAGLEPAERNLLELVSFGEPLGRAELTALGSAAVAEKLEREGLLVSEMSGRRLEIRLAHPLYGDVVRSRTPALRVAELSRALAETVENTAATGPRRREDVLRVGTWRLDGGGASPEVMLAAARAARRRFAFPLAERLATAAVDAGAGFEAELLTVQLAGLQGRTAGVDAKLAALAAAATDDEQRARVAITRLDRLAFHLAEVGQGLQIAEETERAITDPAWRDEVRARRAAVLLMVRSGGPRAATEALEPLLERSTGGTRVWACTTAGYSLGREGRLNRALEVAAEGYELQLRSPESPVWYPWIHLYHRGEALAHLGRLGEAAALAEEQYREAIADGSTEAQAFFAWQRASRVETDGKVVTATLRAREASVLFGQLGRPFFVRHSLIHLAMALALSGNPVDAEATLATIDEMGLPPQLYVYSGDLLHARAWTSAARGDLPAARALLEDAVTLGEATGDLVGQAAALHALARLGQPKRALDALVELAARIDGDLVAARARHTDALVRSHPGDLAQVSESFAAMGATMLAAEAAADESRAWRRRGDARSAAAAERRAATLVTECEGAGTPALAAIGTKDVLTAAERRVALLAAAGRSNKEIADELFVSVRTVEGQLHSVYEKLGIKGRAQLPAALTS